MRRPVIYISDILAWADAFHASVGRWPRMNDGKIQGQLGLTWCAVNLALSKGNRGLPGGSSLAKLLLEQRGRRHKGLLPCYSEAEILAWADAHRERTGDWPSCWSGPIREAPGETWLAVDRALCDGGRGLPGGSSLSQLLTNQRGHRNTRRLPPLTVDQVLTWADAHFARTGAWPTRDSGSIPEAPGETWSGVNQSIHSETRGLAGYGSLIFLLAFERRTRHRQFTPDLTVRDVLAWADAYHDRTGRWPKHTSGPIPESPGETWSAVHGALVEGRRGLPGGSSLARLLALERGVRNCKALAPLTEAQILCWADGHRARTGRWPTARSGAIPEAPGETWAGVCAALHRGRRGLSGGDSLARLLARERGARNPRDSPLTASTCRATLPDGFRLAG